MLPRLAAAVCCFDGAAGTGLSVAPAAPVVCRGSVFGEAGGSTGEHAKHVRAIMPAHTYARAFGLRVIQMPTLP
jgi:hypothetical protein